MSDPSSQTTEADTGAQDLVRFVEAFFDAFDRGEPIEASSLLKTFFPELDKSPTIPKQLNLDDQHHELE